MLKRSLLSLAVALAAATTTSAQNGAGAGAELTTIEIRTLRGQMKYDVEEFQVAPGARVRLVLKNEDDMPHNLIICKPGEDREQEVAKKAWELGAAGFEKNWIPDHPDLLFATEMADPKQSVTLEFTAPETEGTYPYVCTLPGHAMLMNGEMIVGSGGVPSTGKNGLSELTYTLYKGSWQRLPDFSELEPEGTDHVRGGLITLAVAKELSNNFGVVYKAKLEAPADGNYSFKLSSDDGTRLIIDGKTVIDHDGIHATSAKGGSTGLSKGAHELELQYFEGAGEESLALSWSGPGFKDLPLSDQQAQLNNNRKGPSGMELFPPEGEAIIYRNFIEGGGARAIGVGYPQQKNIAYDADQCRLALVWQGAFIDAARHWTGRGQGFQPPLGYNVYSCVEGVPFARLESRDTTWPDTARKRSQQRPDNGYVFKGYTLRGEQRYPEFRYLFEGKPVTDSFIPVSGMKGDAVGETRLWRTITIEGSGSDLYFRAASGDSIEKTPKGGFDIDQGKAHILLDATGSRAVVRESGGKRELLIPISFNDGKATISMSFLFPH